MTAVDGKVSSVYQNTLIRPNLRMQRSFQYSAIIRLRVDKYKFILFFGLNIGDIGIFSVLKALIFFSKWALCDRHLIIKGYFSNAAA